MHPKFDDDPQLMGIYFILEQSRREPSLRRSKILFGCASLHNSQDYHATVCAIANDLEDCEQEVQRLIGAIRRENAAAIATSDALGFYLERLEDLPIREKLEMIWFSSELGLRPPTELPNDQLFTDAWSQANGRITDLENRFELLLHRIRTRGFSLSNREASIPLAAAANAA